MSFSLLWLCKKRVRLEVALQVTSGIEHQELSSCTGDVAAV